MPEFIITYDGCRQGYILYLEVHDIRIILLILKDREYEDERIKTRLNWLIERATWIQQEKPPYGNVYRKCKATPEIMQLVKELQDINYALRIY